MKKYNKNELVKVNKNLKIIKVCLRVSVEKIKNKK